ncbi:hypothetical protein SAMN05216557_10790 [Sphingomonas carotinifaciens]|uniref:Uncharacterized protein n=1 Tax=Sphingomonas carotinifaciens TaxID=1166323 RepID=A0A1G7PXG2_9SPHN|nr:hypothetical protein SAMN05216557_10790 [Sphingomonas carotinifaciens]
MGSTQRLPSAIADQLRRGLDRPLADPDRHHGAIVEQLSAAVTCEAAQARTRARPFSGPRTCRSAAIPPDQRSKHSLKLVIAGPRATELLLELTLVSGQVHHRAAVVQHRRKSTDPTKLAIEHDICRQRVSGRYRSGGDLHGLVSQSVGLTPRPRLFPANGSLFHAANLCVGSRHQNDVCVRSAAPALLGEAYRLPLAPAVSFLRANDTLTLFGKAARIERACRRTGLFNIHLRERPGSGGGPPGPCSSGPRGPGPPGPGRSKPPGPRRSRITASKICFWR